MKKLYLALACALTALFFLTSSGITAQGNPTNLIKIDASLLTPGGTTNSALAEADAIELGGSGLKTEYLVQSTIFIKDLMVDSRKVNVVLNENSPENFAGDNNFSYGIDKKNLFLALGGTFSPAEIVLGASNEEANFITVTTKGPPTNYGVVDSNWLSVMTRTGGSGIKVPYLVGSVLGRVAPSVDSSA